jgi:hypothetical protein
LTPQVEADVLAASRCWEGGVLHLWWLLGDTQVSARAQLSALEEDEDDGRLEELLRNPSASADVRALATRTDDPWVREALGSCPALSEEEQVGYRRDHGWLGLARNPSLVPALRADAFAELGECVNGCTCQELSERRDLSCEEVALLAAEHPRSRDGLLESAVGIGADQVHALFEALLEGEQVVKLVALGPHLSASDAEVLLAHPDERYRRAGAQSSALGEDRQRELLDEPASRVGLASNTALAPDLQEVLEQDPVLRGRLLSNPALSRELVERLWRDERKVLEAPSVTPELVRLAVSATLLEEPEELAWFEGHPALEIHEDLPAVLVGEDMLDDLLDLAEDRGADLVTLLVLKDGWLGTVGELLETAEELR